MFGANQQKDANRIFFVARFWDNAPKGYEKIDSERANYIKQMVAKEN